MAAAPAAWQLPAGDFAVVETVSGLPLAAPPLPPPLIARPIVLVPAATPTDAPSVAVVSGAVVKIQGKSVGLPSRLHAQLAGESKGERRCSCTNAGRHCRV